VPDLFYFLNDFSMLRLCGVIGFLIYVSLYVSLALRWINSDDVVYFIGCVLAAALVLVSLTQDFNLASALIQGFWIVMGIPAIIIRLARKRSNRVAGDPADLEYSHGRFG